MAPETVPTSGAVNGRGRKVGESDLGGGREQPPFGCGFREVVRRADPPFPVRQTREEHD